MTMIMIMFIIINIALDSINKDGHAENIKYLKKQYAQQKSLKLSHFYSMKE